MANLKKRQKEILRALYELGGEATTKAIAETAGMNVNGVSQSLGALSETYVRYLDGEGGVTTWRLVRPHAYR